MNHLKNPMDQVSEELNDFKLLHGLLCTLSVSIYEEVKILQEYNFMHMYQPCPQAHYQLLQHWH